MKANSPYYGWTNPLTEAEIVSLRESNNQNGPSEVINGPIGPMLRLVCTLNMNSYFHNKVYYCGGNSGGNSNVWMPEDVFFELYPEYDNKPKMVVDMELDEIHQAEEIMEGLCQEDR